MFFSPLRLFCALAEFNLSLLSAPLRLATPPSKPAPGPVTHDYVLDAPQSAEPKLVAPVASELLVESVKSEFASAPHESECASVPVEAELPSVPVELELASVSIEADEAEFASAPVDSELAGAPLDSVTPKETATLAPQSIGFPLAPAVEPPVSGKSVAAGPAEYLADVAPVAIGSPIVKTAGTSSGPIADSNARPKSDPFTAAIEAVSDSKPAAPSPESAAALVAATIASTNTPVAKSATPFRTAGLSPMVKTRAPAAPAPTIKSPMPIESATSAPTSKSPGPTKPSKKKKKR